MELLHNACHVQEPILLILKGDLCILQGFLCPFLQLLRFAVQVVNLPASDMGTIGRESRIWSLQTLVCLPIMVHMQPQPKIPVAIDATMTHYGTDSELQVKLQLLLSMYIAQRTAI